ncbi:MAG: hypothetical protein II233_02270 [Clostridia bacterium]|nr:hypothetical protein [Clostridia bacterium]
MIKKPSFVFFNMTTLMIAGILLLLLSAVILLLHGNSTSNQAEPAFVAQVYFDGEYRIADGPWQKIVKGNHIPSTEGDVTLRGNFHMLTPVGEYVGVYRGDTPIAIYTNHINLTFYEGENEPYVFDMENPLFGDSLCGVGWFAYSFTSESEKISKFLFIIPIILETKLQLMSCCPIWLSGQGLILKKVFSKVENRREVLGFCLLLYLFCFWEQLCSQPLYILRIVRLFGCSVS